MAPKRDSCTRFAKWTQTVGFLPLKPTLGSTDTAIVVVITKFREDCCLNRPPDEKKLDWL